MKTAHKPELKLKEKEEKEMKKQERKKKDLNGRKVGEDS